MTKEVIAYQSLDGKLHLSKDEADFSDYSSMLTADMTDFLAHMELSDEDKRIRNIICKWEMWKLGGYAGWQAQNRAEAAGTPPPVAPVAVASPQPAPVPVAVDYSKPTKPAKPAKVARPAPAYKKHIAVIGLFNTFHHSIEDEFGDVFKLTLHDSDCLPKITGLKQCHKVICMQKFISHKHVQMLRAIGQEPLVIYGGIDKLKETITSIYVNG